MRGQHPCSSGWWQPHPPYCNILQNIRKNVKWSPKTLFNSNAAAELSVYARTSNSCRLAISKRSLTQPLWNATTATFCQTRLCICAPFVIKIFFIPPVMFWCTTGERREEASDCIMSLRFKYQRIVLSALPHRRPPAFMWEVHVI